MLRTHFAQHHPACHNCAPPGCSYDVEGRRLEKKGRRDRLERHIAKADSLGKVRGALGGSVYIIGMVGCQGMRSAARGKHDSCASSRGGCLQRLCRLHNPAHAALSLLSFSAFCQH